MAITRLTTAPRSNLLEVVKSTTTQSITRGDWFYLSSGKAVLASTITAGTSTNIIGISDTRSVSGESKPIRFFLDEFAEYQGTLNTSTTMTAGDYLKLVSGYPQKVAKAATTTDARVAQCIENKSAASTIRFRILARTIVK